MPEAQLWAQDLWGRLDITMTESIFVRVKRVVSGGIYDSVDAMERAGGASVMREAVREVERVADEVKGERDNATASRLQAIRLQSLYKERLTSLQEKAEFAIDQDREDLAEAALLRQVEFEEQIEALTKSEEEAGEKERHLEECLASLTMRKAQMSEELKAFEESRRDAGVGVDTDGASKKQKDDRVERAEAAFDRAISGASGDMGTARTDMENAAKVVEIDAMQKKSVIEERMAVLRKRKKAS